MSEALLATENLTKRFEGVTAVNDVSTTFDEDSLHAVIGPNGAGKTTFFNLLTGALRPTSGRIYFDGEDITELSPEEIARQRLTRSYQVTNVFDELSVLENVRVSIQARHSMYNFWSKASSMPDLVTEAEAILDRVGLLNKREQNAEILSHGERRTLELAVALGTDPKMLLLDEPTSGMSSEETKEMIGLISELASDVTIVLVEHKMSVVMQVSDRIKVLHRGQIIADGTPREVQNDEEVRRVYLEGGAE